MKKAIHFIVAAAGTSLLVSCGTDSKEIEKETQVQVEESVTNTVNDAFSALDEMMSDSTATDTTAMDSMKHSEMEKQDEPTEGETSH